MTNEALAVIILFGLWPFVAWLILKVEFADMEKERENERRRHRRLGRHDHAVAPGHRRDRLGHRVVEGSKRKLNDQGTQGEARGSRDQ
jgi:hypothetical protein